LWKPFAQQNHKKATYELSSTRSVRCWSALLRDNAFCDEFAEEGEKLLLCLPVQTNTPKDVRLYTKTD